MEVWSLDWSFHIDNQCEQVRRGGHWIHVHLHGILEETSPSGVHDKHHCAQYISTLD